MQTSLIPSAADAQAAARSLKRAFSDTADVWADTARSQFEANHFGPILEAAEAIASQLDQAAQDLARAMR